MYMTHTAFWKGSLGFMSYGQLQNHQNEKVPLFVPIMAGMNQQCRTHLDTWKLVGSGFDYGGAPCHMKVVDVIDTNGVHPQCHYAIGLHG